LPQLEVAVAFKKEQRGGSHKSSEFPGGSLGTSDLTLPTGPLDETAECGVLKQRLDGVVMPPKVFLTGNQIVNRFVAVAADVDSLAHLLTCVTLLEPLVRVAAAGNQVMFGRSQLWLAAAKGARRDL